jgi:hypothetical protein
MSSLREVFSIFRNFKCYVTTGEPYYVNMPVVSNKLSMIKFTHLWLYVQLIKKQGVKPAIFMYLIILLTIASPQEQII